MFTSSQIIILYTYDWVKGNKYLQNTDRCDFYFCWNERKLLSTYIVRLVYLKELQLGLPSVLQFIVFKSDFVFYIYHDLNIAFMNHSIWVLMVQENVGRIGWIIMNYFKNTSYLMQSSRKHIAFWKNDRINCFVWLSNEQQ